MRQHSIITFCGLLSGVACPAAFAENIMTIDDFTVGEYHSGAYKSGGIRTLKQSGSSGHLLGGNREEDLYVCPTTPDSSCADQNPYGQYASFAIGADKSVSPPINALVVGSGFDDGLRLELWYGTGAPMAANLSAYSVVRVNFRGLTGSLNFNVEGFTGSSYVQNACNLTPNLNPFVVEFPFSGFVTNAPGFSWSDVNNLLFIFQSVGDSLGITSIEVSDTPNPNAIRCSLVSG